MVGLVRPEWRFPTSQPLDTVSSLSVSCWHRTVWGGESKVSRLMLGGRWVKKHLVNCHPGDLRVLFLEEVTKGGC